MEWNEGRITSLWKGKGDKEQLTNHRGITTSSAIGTIFDSLLDNRIEKIVPFTEAQGGGKSGSSTCDHLFLLYAMIEISKKKNKETYVTFYDISKAYDNANNPDMLTIIWDKGLKGKCWRLLRNLNTDLKARIKTRFGITRQIDMNIGGKQGSRLTGRQFAKMMDMLAEDLMNDEKGFRLTDTFRIAVLLWVDDVVSCVEGRKNQQEILNRLDEFAVKHRLEWSASKCRVMRIGKRNTPTVQWKLGNLIIQETNQYKYLGDDVTYNGRHNETIKSRKQKTQAATATINTIASSDVINKVESIVLLELHERITIPNLLYNAEAWVLNKTEINEIERVELQALKSLFKLPIQTPNAAIVHTFGTLFTKQRIDQRQLLYLHKVLNRPNTDWTLQTLNTLQEMNIGWAKNMNAILTHYNLPTDFQEIKSTPRPQWSNKVKSSIEKRHLERLRDQ